MSKCQLEGAQFLHLAFQGGRSPFAPSSVKPLTLMCIWLPFQTKEALFAALRLSFYINYKRLLHLMAIFCCVSDSTRVLALFRGYSRFVFNEDSTRVLAAC